MASISARVVNQVLNLRGDVERRCPRLAVG